MPKQSGLGDNFYVAGYDLSGDVASIDQLSTPWDTIDFTVIKDFAHERQNSLRTGDMQFTTFFDLVGTTDPAPGFPTSGAPGSTSTVNWFVLVSITGGTVTNVVINGVQVGTGPGAYVLPPLGNIQVTYTGVPAWVWTPIGAEHQALSTLPTTDELGTYFRGTAIGNPAASINGKQINYDWTRDNTANITGKVEIQANSFGLEWGKQLTNGVRTDNAAASGASIDDGAATNFGAQAYMQLLSFSGTSVDIAVQDSADNASFANVTGLDFGAQSSAPFTSRLAISNTSTLRRYVRVNTTGTFTYARFIVMYNRNLVAGVSF